jgi:O-6-methylguanine DNA methyltransferase
LAQVDGFICPVTVVSSNRGVKEIHFSPVDAVADKLTQQGISYTLDLFHSAAIQLSEYFNGQRQSFETPLDIHGTPFHLQVWRVLQLIPYGQVQSYKDIAMLIGRPSAFRAVGQACGVNPIPIIIPCHRVLTADRKLSGFSRGIEIKRALLELEGVCCFK